MQQFPCKNKNINGGSERTKMTNFVPTNAEKQFFKTVYVSFLLLLP